MKYERWVEGAGSVCLELCVYFYVISGTWEEKHENSLRSIAANT